ncbi:MAG TPA: AraC family ligand binding domain-containing protein, partial [Candidatus Acidoferrum sp.]|nr:AraC family ligand binding domain-containing protein [Candidatus Acidoferrum sp.]
MLQKRQAAIFDRTGGGRSPIATLTRDYPAGHVIPSHFHNRDQLVYATRGVMTVRTGQGAWIVPTHRAVWIPASVAHTITMSGTVAMRTLYLRLRLARRLPRACCVINVPPLLRELILHACTLAGLRNTVHRQRHLIRVILDQLEIIQTVPLQLPTP